MKNNDRIIIEKIQKYCRDISDLKNKYNNSFALFEEDISFQYSCNMCIIQIGELVGRLSDSFRDSHNDIPWQSIKGMRNLYAHDYDKIDLDIVWNTLQTDIPEFNSKLQIILDS